MTPPSLRRRCLLVVPLVGALLAPSGPVLAQDVPADPAPSAAELPPSPFSAAGDEALALVESGDVAAAIARLADPAVASALTTADRSLLGSLYLNEGRAADAWEVLAPLAEDPAADAAVLYNAGLAALGTSRIEEGVELLERSVALAPISPAARELGMIEGRRGNPDRAYRLLASWIAQRPGDEPARLAAATAALQIDRPDDAARLLDGLGDTPGTRLLRAQVALQRHDPQGALNLLETLLPDPAPAMRSDVLRLAGEAYIVTGRSGKAAELLADRAAGDPRLALLLADARYRTGDLQGGIEALAPFVTKIMDADELPRAPIVGDLLANYGRLLVAAGRAEEAIAPLELATGRDPEKAAAWKSLGDALGAAGRSEEARTALARFQELAARQRDEAMPPPRSPVERAMRTATERRAEGDVEGAVAALRAERELSPDDPRLGFLEVQILLGAGRKEEALAAANAAVARFPDNADAIYQRGVVELTLEREPEAERDLRRALDLAPEHTAAMNDLAVLLIADGRRDEARKLLERVLALRPEDAAARQNLERLQNPGR